MQEDNKENEQYLEHAIEFIKSIDSASIDKISEDISCVLENKGGTPSDTGVRIYVLTIKYMAK